MSNKLLTTFKCIGTLTLLVGIAGCGGGSSPSANAERTAEPLTEAPPFLAEENVTTVTPEAPSSYIPPFVDKTVQKTQARIGANVAAPGLYSKAMEYVDLVRHAEGFGHVEGPWIEKPVKVGSDGWPQEDFSIFLSSRLPADKDPKTRHTYTIAFTGKAKISMISKPEGVVLHEPVFDEATGTTHAKIDYPGGENDMVLVFSNTNGGVKNLRVLRPGYAWNDPNLPVFTPEYLKHLEPFSTLRFMDWLASNILYETSWTNRPTLTNTRGGLTQRGGVPGYPWERVIELANASKSDVWINIPTKADPVYVANLAALLKRELAGNLKIYVEYGNEFWNFNFPQYHWLTSTAVDEAIAAGNKTLARDGETSKVLLGYRLYAEKLVAASDAFSTVFGKEEMMKRVRPVLTWQGGGTYYTNFMLDHLKAIYPNRPVNDYLYAISGAPYFSLGEEHQTKEGLTTAQVISYMKDQISLAPTMYRYEYGAYLAKKHNLQWIAYEGGPDTFGEGSIESKANANRHPDMLTMCQGFLDQWSKAGGGLFMWYFAGVGGYGTKYGTWPIEEDLTPQVPSQKYQCMTWASMEPAPLPTSRHAPGIQFDAAEIAGQFPLPGSSRSQPWYAANQEVDYVVSSPEPAKKCRDLEINSLFTEASPKFQILVNGVEAIKEGTLSVAKNNVPVQESIGKICLDPGINILTVKFSGNTWGFMNKLRVQP